MECDELVVVVLGSFFLKCWQHIGGCQSSGKLSG